MKTSQILLAPNGSYGYDLGISSLAGLADIYDQGQLNAIVQQAQGFASQLPNLTEGARVQLARYFQTGGVDRAGWNLIEESFYHTMNINNGTAIVTRNQFFNRPRQDFVCNLESGKIGQTDTIGIGWNVAVALHDCSVSSTDGTITWNPVTTSFSSDALLEAYRNLKTHIIEHGVLELRQNNKRLLRRLIKHLPPGSGSVPLYATTQTAEGTVAHIANGLTDPRVRTRMQAPVMLLPDAPISAVLEIPSGCPALPASTSIAATVEIIGHQIEPGGVLR